MPIMSYLAYPAPGQQQALQQALSQLPECAVIPADNNDLLILVTDTSDEPSEKALQTKLAEIPALHCLAMVSGFLDAESTPTTTT